MLAALRPAQTLSIRPALSLGKVTLRPPPLISLRTASTMAVPRDVQQFLRGYPGQGSSTSSSTPNLEFYRNAAPCRPDGLLYEDWIKRYEGDYHELESNHSYIQWFFPIPEQGVNPYASPLSQTEMEAMATDDAVLRRLLRSYIMMLQFYGIDFNNGHLRPAQNSADRLANLASRPHNLLRLTRIIKCLSLFDRLQPHAAPLVLYFVALHSEGVLPMTGMRGDSLEKWWANCFRDEGERAEVQRIVGARGRAGGRAWGWDKYNAWVDERGKNGLI